MKLRNPLLIYSIWIGYFDKDEAIKKFIKDKDIRYEHIHTSGHADINKLKQLTEILKPKMLIPVHTEKPLIFKELFDNVVMTKEIEI